MTYVEFYFPGISLEGRKEREVFDRDTKYVLDFPDYSYAFRFFDKDASGNKTNFSNYYYIGKEYTKEQYETAYPQGENFNSSRVVSLVTGGFLPLKDDDVVVA